MISPVLPPLPCEFCNGMGEIRSFKGVSRFLLSLEECPICHGTGLAPATEPLGRESTEEDAAD